MPSFKPLSPAVLPRIFPCFSITWTKMCSWASLNWDSSLARDPESHMAHVPCIMMVSIALMCDWFSVAPGPEWPSVMNRACLKESYSLLLGMWEGPSLIPGTLENIFWFAALVLSALSLHIRPLVANNKIIAVGKHLFTCLVQNQGSSASFSRKAPRWGLKGCAYLEVCLWAFSSAAVRSTERMRFAGRPFLNRVSKRKSQYDRLRFRI